jgi:hypothetical protein
VLNLLASGVIGHIVTKTLITLGIGFLSYVGFMEVLDLIKQQAVIALGPTSTASNIMGLFGFDLFLGYIFSAYTAVFSLRVIKKLKLL